MVIHASKKEIKKGAIAIVIEEGCDLKAFKVPEGITVVMTKDTREALAIIASNFYGNPSSKFKLIGVTGTKGNTTTVRPLMIIYNKKDWKVESYDIEDYYGSRTKTLCSNRKQTLDFAGKLIELPCNNQNAIINKFNITSKILIAKNKIKGKSLIRKK